ncbi:YkgJ family cysteine cluster protein [Synergistaceae bacterium OttesenSCG-928-D05]|nr:YkgJ family cysteine cluster protein [Synergistaceae bacterium OttesenSCG-928-D05]
MTEHLKNEPVDENSTQWWEREEVRFECKQCGNCCGGEPGAIWLTAQETAAIAASLELSEAEFRKQYLTRNMGRSSIKELENYDCIFLKRNQNLCAIYEVRPLQCKLFPFWPSILRDKNVWNYYATRCPGMNSGKLYTKEIILNLQKMDIWQDL